MALASFHIFYVKKKPAIMRTYNLAYSYASDMSVV